MKGQMQGFYSYHLERFYRLDGGAYHGVETDSHTWLYPFLE